MASSTSPSSNHHPSPSPLINVKNFVSIKLSPSNYKLWETQMFCFIESMELVGFIDGTNPPPPETVTVPDFTSISIHGTKELENQDYLLWRRSDRLLKGWILGSLSKDVLATVVGCKTSIDVWTKLQSSYGSFSQGSFNITDPSLFEEEKGEYEEEQEGLNISKYVPLYKAALRGDWDSAQGFFFENPDAKTAPITLGWQRAIHVAVGSATGKANRFVNELVELMPVGTLGMQNSDGNTALSFAAMVGNTQAAKVLVKKDPSLLDIENNYGSLPLHMAAEYAHRETLSFLLTATEDYKSSRYVEFSTGVQNRLISQNAPPDPFVGQSGIKLLVGVIISGFIDIALYLVQRYPHLARLRLEKGDSPLTAITRKASAFPSGTHLHFWESVIYYFSPVMFYDYINGPCYYDDQSGVRVELRDRLLREGGNYYGSGQRGTKSITGMLWRAGGLMVSRIIHPKKLIHHQALQLVKCLCKTISLLNDQHSYRLQCKKPILLAASLGINEVIEEIVDKFPHEIWSNNEERHYIFQLAVIHRCEKVFNLIYQMSGHKYSFSALTDTSQNNILHLAGKLAPPHKLNLVPGAALQMQRELQWFKVVEEFANPACKEEQNSSKETPAMVFTREHSNLMMEGEKWMKETANSCTIAAALIATVVFAAAITVPGCNSNSPGLTIFSQNTAFVIFSASDAISLFTSTTSLLMFLSILTARYSEQDFLYSLPKRLIIGLVTLFVSITSMMIAATLYLVFAQSEAWILSSVVAMAALPVIAFMFLQFPLLIHVFSATYGQGIFGKQSRRPFY